MVGGVQFHGSSCSSLVIGVSAMRARTSASHACGSMSLSLAVMIRVAVKAARFWANLHSLHSYSAAPLNTPF